MRSSLVHDNSDAPLEGSSPCVESKPNLLTALVLLCRATC